MIYNGLSSCAIMSMNSSLMACIQWSYDLVIMARVRIMFMFSVYFEMARSFLIVIFFLSKFIS